MYFHALEPRLNLPSSGGHILLRILKIAAENKIIENEKRNKMP